MQGTLSCLTWCWDLRVCLEHRVSGPRRRFRRPSLIGMSSERVAPALAGRQKFAIFQHHSRRHDCRSRSRFIKVSNHEDFINIDAGGAELFGFRMCLQRGKCLPRQGHYDWRQWQSKMRHLSLYIHAGPREPHEQFASDGGCWRMQGRRLHPQYRLRVHGRCDLRRPRE